MKTSGKYILVDKKPVEVTDLLEWAKAFETMDRHVAQDHVGKVKISTVFLGLDHSFAFNKENSVAHRPILFETMIFKWKHDNKMWRYATWAEAEAGHQRAVEIVKGEKDGE